MTTRLVRNIPFTDEKLLNLLEQAVERYNAITPEQKREMREAQRKSWVVGEMLIEHPQLTREYVEAIYEEVR